MAREFELKFAATEQQLQQLRQQFGPFDSISMETTYYDTPDQALSQRSITLRRRMEGGVSVCTLKTPDVRGGRGEWELECDSIEAAIPELCKLSGWEQLAQLTKDGVVPVCGARFTRQAKRICLPECEVELALDQGVLLGGGKARAFWEVETELKSGSEAAVVAFGEQLAAQYGLATEKRSKFRRALALAKGER